jgi:hypothetical protein
MKFINKILPYSLSIGLVALAFTTTGFTALGATNAGGEVIAQASPNNSCPPDNPDDPSCPSNVPNNTNTNSGGNTGAGNTGSDPCVNNAEPPSYCANTTSQNGNGNSSVNSSDGQNSSGSGVNKTNTGLCKGIPGTTEINYTCIPNGDRLANCSSSSLSLSCITSLGGAINLIIRIGLMFAGIIAVIFIMLGGYQLLISRGDPNGYKKGRTTITQAAIGLIIVLLAYVIVQFITSLVGPNGLKIG